MVRALCRPGPEAGGAAGAAGAAGAGGAESVVRVVGGPWVWAECALVGAPADEDDSRPDARDWLREINARAGGAGAQGGGRGGGGGGPVLALAAEGAADAHLLQCEVVWGARSDGAAQLLLKDSVLARSGVGADGLSAGGSSGARLERCLLAGHARAALGVRDAARVEADLCEFSESPGAAVLHADYPGPQLADPASLHREWPSAVELTRCVVTLGGADALWRGNRWRVREHEFRDNLLDDRIPRSFVREGAGYLSGPDTANANVSRSTALRGADHAPVAGPFMGEASFLAANFEHPPGEGEDAAGAGASGAAGNATAGADEEEEEEHEAARERALQQQVDAEGQAEGLEEDEEVAPPSRL